MLFGLRRCGSMVLSRLGVLLAVLPLLAACMSDPVPAPQGLRDVTKPIGSSTRFDPARFGGLWYRRAGGIKGKPALRITPEGAGFAVAELGPDGVVLARYTLTAGPRVGQFQTQGDGGTRAFWLLWVDEGWRTMALGNPKGSIGAIYDRAPKGGADRIAAATEIMTWYGYDMAQLAMRP